MSARGRRAARPAPPSSSTAVKAGEVEEAKEALPGGPRPVGAHRAGGGVVRRPRPDDRRPRGRHRRGHGVHRLPPPREGPLGRRPPEGQQPIADKLLADVKQIVAKAKAVELNPLQLANGSKALLDEVATGKITGEEDRYSHTDLYDFDENYGGSKDAIDALRPALKERDPELLTTIDARFKELDAELDKHRTDGGFRLYTDLSTDEVKDLTVKLDAVSEQVAKVAEVVAEVTEQASASPAAASSVSAPGRPSPAPSPALPARMPRGGLPRLPRPARPLRPGRARALPRRPPGRHHHAGAGPDALRGPRRHHRRPGRSWSRRSRPGRGRRSG